MQFRGYGWIPTLTGNIFLNGCRISKKKYKKIIFSDKTSIIRLNETYGLVVERNYDFDFSISVLDKNNFKPLFSQFSKPFDLVVLKNSELGFVIYIFDENKSSSLKYWGVIPYGKLQELGEEFRVGVIKNSEFGLTIYIIGKNNYNLLEYLNEKSPRTFDGKHSLIALENHGSGISIYNIDEASKNDLEYWGLIPSGKLKLLTVASNLFVKTELKSDIDLFNELNVLYDLFIRKDSDLGFVIYIFEKNDPNHLQYWVVFSETTVIEAKITKFSKDGLLVCDISLETNEKKIQEIIEQDPSTKQELMKCIFADIRDIYHRHTHHTAAETKKHSPPCCIKEIPCIADETATEKEAICDIIDLFLGRIVPRYWRINMYLHPDAEFKDVDLLVRLIREAIGDSLYGQTFCFTFANQIPAHRKWEYEHSAQRFENIVNSMNRFVNQIDAHNSDHANIAALFQSMLILVLTVVMIILMALSSLQKDILMYIAIPISFIILFVLTIMSPLPKYYKSLLKNIINRKT